MDRLTELRNGLLRACAGYDADEGIRAMASALTTMIIGLHGAPRRRALSA
jgi:hypothetical protein